MVCIGDNMKIGIIGATGMAGKRLVAEGIKRGHEITAIVRNEIKAKEVLGAEVRLLVKDVFLLEKSDLDQFDVVVNAFATDPGHAYQHVDVVAKLVAMFREVEQPRFPYQKKHIKHFCFYKTQKM